MEEQIMKKRIRLMINLVIGFRLTPVKILKWVGKAGMYVIKTPVKICKNKIVKKTVVKLLKCYAYY